MKVSIEDRLAKLERAVAKLGMARCFCCEEWFKLGYANRNVNHLPSSIGQLIMVCHDCLPDYLDLATWPKQSTPRVRRLVAAYLVHLEFRQEPWISQVERALPGITEEAAKTAR